MPRTNLPVKFFSIELMCCLDGSRGVIHKKHFMINTFNVEYFMSFLKFSVFCLVLVIITLLGPVLIKTNTVTANFNNTRPVWILNN